MGITNKGGKQIIIEVKSRFKRPIEKHFYI